MASISSKVPSWVGAPWEILNDWSTHIYDPMTKKYGLKNRSLTVRSSLPQDEKMQWGSHVQDFLL